MKTIYKIIAIIAILVVIIFIIAKIFNIEQIILKNIYPKKYESYVEKYAKENNIDPLLIFSIIKAESNFKEKAESSSGAIGLMQLMEKTAEEIAENMNQPIADKENLKEAETNIKIGVKYYSILQKNYNGNMLLALTAYNAGMGNVNTWIKSGIIKSDGSDIENIPYKETNMYVRKIIRNYKMYNKIY